MPANFLTRGGFQYPTDNLVQETVYKTAYRYSTSPFTVADAWGSSSPLIKTFPLVAGVASVVSTNVNDTAAGTGAQRVRVEGLDANWNRVSEEFETNGLTPVVGTVEFLRVFNMVVVRVGTLLNNLGVVSASVGGLTQEHIVGTGGSNFGHNAAQSFHYTVPAGKVGYLTRFAMNPLSGAINSTQHLGFFITRQQTLIPDNSIPFSSLFAIGANAIAWHFATPFRLEERTDITLRIASFANFFRFSGSYELVLVDKPDPVIAGPILP